MTPTALSVSGDPGPVWRVGFAPDPWQWTPWEYAQDEGRFNGRWDDQLAKFRTLYTSDTLLGCFLELLAQERPNDVVFTELEQIVDDDDAVTRYPDPERGALGLDWLGDRRYGHGNQDGTYAEVTRIETIAYLTAEGIFDRLGVPPRAVDTALLKDARQRDLTRSVARFLYDLHDENRRPVVDGVAFRSRLDDEIRLWAVFDREGGTVSEHVDPESGTHQVTEDTPELLRAFELLGLHWRSNA
jgi:hypothetical protein